MKKAILCIDDERIVLESLKGQLRKNFGSEYQYEFAESADEGFEIIEELVAHGTQILIIVSDWLMPDVKGDEFLIAVHKRFPQIVKVLLSGQAAEKAIKNAQENANLHRFIYKPWEEEELVETIRSGLAINYTSLYE
ncbi:response regulator [Thermoflexibacter ruber]|uniref:CheY chemotaxis protein or a CheY-like REC (Receiver) domain n=1 Tax=Thermoflexibacter ruber TaxID=1003 RepID=A0A1I2G7R7_9BACT|nr:response regulator [Thermoflexibacter ruber]SFF13209.1 CheY chemotaxis protein or a CheY-like REC (receiver) domain [Thermoflexibacter ruber]